MITRIENAPRDYEWGSKTLLADLGYPAIGRPMAEVWFGTHPLCESIAQPSGRALSVELGHALPFMVKFLAAAKPLSIQVHPDEAQAKAGFESENLRGLAIDDRNRNFKDASAKREAIVAVSEFELLVGLKPIAEIRKLFTELVANLTGAAGELAEGYLESLDETSDVESLLNRILDSEQTTEDQLELLEQLRHLNNQSAAANLDRDLVANLFENFGLDRGILVALLMIRISLKPGEAVFVDAGVPHSYLSGLGVEILDSSDNVLRGGLTNKHLSPRDFLEVLNVTKSLGVQSQSPRALSNGLSRYDLAGAGFNLHRIQVSGTNLLADFRLSGEGILVCTSGELDLSNSLGEFLKIRRGEAAYLSQDANFFTVAGSGEGFLGMANA